MIRIEPIYPAQAFIFILLGIFGLAMTFFLVGINNGPLQPQITKSERVAVMLRTCFPGGVYANSAPACEAFKDYITAQADKAEVSFNEGRK